MRKKEKKLVVTFHTTADAMALEQVCQEQSVPGRLIPVPRAISAGCGLAWCTDLTCETVLKKALKSAGIAEEGMQECMV